MKRLLLNFNKIRASLEKMEAGKGEARADEKREKKAKRRRSYYVSLV